MTSDFNTAARIESEKFIDCLSRLCEGYDMEYTGSCAVFLSLADRPVITDISIRCTDSEMIGLVHAALGMAGMNPEVIDPADNGSLTALRVTLASGLQMQIRLTTCSELSVSGVCEGINFAELGVSIPDLCSDFSREFTLERILAMYFAYDLVKQNGKLARMIEYALAQYGRDRIFRVMHNYFKSNGEYVYNNKRMFRAIPKWLNNLQCFAGWTLKGVLSWNSSDSLRQFCLDMKQEFDPLLRDTDYRCRLNDRVIEELLDWIYDEKWSVIGIEPRLVGCKRDFLLKRLLVCRSGYWSEEAVEDITHRLQSFNAKVYINSDDQFLTINYSDGQGHAGTIILEIFECLKRSDMSASEWKDFQDAREHLTESYGVALSLNSGILSFLASSVMDQIRHTKSIYAFVIFIEIYRHCRETANKQAIKDALTGMANMEPDVIDAILDPRQEDRQYLLASFNLQSYMADYKEICEDAASL